MEDCNLISPAYGAIDLAPGMPKAIPDMLMPGGKANYAEGKYGNLVSQEIIAGPFTIHYDIYHIETRFLLVFKPCVPSLSIHIILKNDMHYHLSNIGDVYMKEGQFNIAYLPGVEGGVLFEQAGEYRVFKVCFPAEILQQYAAAFPYLNDFLQELTKESNPAFLLKEHGWISSRISYIINEILECTYEEPVRLLYHDSLVKELLLLLLLQKQSSGTDHNTYMQSLYEAKSIIEKNTSKHFTTGKIAGEVGLNEARLKSGFKQVFGIGLPQFVLQAKMQKAWVLVLETDKPVEEIARLTGYRTRQNFVTAFKKYFNTTPDALRKKE